MRRRILLLLPLLYTAILARGQSQKSEPRSRPLLDVLRVHADGDASSALVTPRLGPVREVRCDVVIIGGGLGAVSAALAATSGSHTVCMTEPTLWVGGQATSQGVSAFDDNQYIDTTGGTASYLDFSRRIREYYATFRSDSATPIAKAIQGPIANPGGCWVSKLCFEPGPAQQILRQLLAPALASGRLKLWLHTVPVEVERNRRLLRSVLIYDFEHHAWLRLHAAYFVEASEMGDLLELSHLPFRIGAEAQAETHERNAPLIADPHASQSFTYPFILETGLSPASAEARPPDFESFLKQYTLVVDYGAGKFLTYGFYEAKPNLPGSFWVYRRSVDASRFRPGAFSSDRSMINWSSNDFCDANLLSRDPLLQAEALQKAKRLSLGFAWWIRHSAPHDDGTGAGYSELRVQPDAMGSDDGLSQHPYMRESRRIIPLRTIVEEDVAVDFQKNSRSVYYPDSIGIGWYPIDIHSCDRQDFVSQTRPYQIPFGALIARDADNLLAVGKTIGTTHITNGAYRLHPTEWTTGEAVGYALAWSLDRHVQPTAVDQSPVLLHGLQRYLVQHGHPIFWYDDVPVASRDFATSQMAGQFHWWLPDTMTLHADPGNKITFEEVSSALRTLNEKYLLREPVAARPLLWSDIARTGASIGRYAGIVRRVDFAAWLSKQSDR